jgi:MFS family permease
VALRLLQGLAIGGEFGGAVTYIAEHADPKSRGLTTSWLQVTGTIGLLLSLAVILGLRTVMSPESFASWGWRVPFLLSVLLLVWSMYMRSQLHESPVFREMKAAGKTSQNPVKDVFMERKALVAVLVTIFGAVAGQAVIWYTAHFYTLQYMTATLKMPQTSVYGYLTLALVLATPFFVFFGWLSDKVGRKWLILSGCLLSAALFVPLFQGLAKYGNPGLMEFRERTQVVIQGGDCKEDQTFMGQLFNPKATKPCTRAKSFLTSQGLAYRFEPASTDLRIVINGTAYEGFDEKVIRQVLIEKGMPTAADPQRVNGSMIVLLLFCIIFLATMVYGPMGAFLVEQFPTKIRYSGVSVALQFGNGWIGGFAPFVATSMVVNSGDMFRGLMYTVAVALGTVVIGAILVRDRSRADMREEEAVGVIGTGRAKRA